MGLSGGIGTQRRRAMATEQGWVIKRTVSRGHGSSFCSGVSRTRKDAICCFIHLFHRSTEVIDKYWRRYYRQGYRAVHADNR